MKKISHLPFFTALDDYPDGGAAWHALSTGYLVLRVFDDWLKIGSEKTREDLADSAHRREVGKMEEVYQPEKRVLETLLNMMTEERGLSVGTVVSALLAYGQLLEYRKHLAPAADVYETVANALRVAARADFRSIAHALIRAGSCWAREHDFDRAVECYTQARSVAADTADSILQIQVRGSLANVSRDRGDLRSAEDDLDELLTDVLGLTTHVKNLTQPWVLHCRGAVRHARKKYAEAIQDFYEAYTGTLDPFARELILSDLGACASDFGCRNMARNALETIIVGSRNPLANQNAVVNLMEIAMLDGDQFAFNRWKSLWAPEQCNPRTNIYVRLLVARSLERFVGRDAAMAAFAEVVELAEKAKIHQVQFEALHDFDRLQEMRAVEERRVTEVPPSLYDIDEALAELREFVDLSK